MKTVTAIVLAVGAVVAFKFLGLGTAANVAQIVFNGITVNSPINYTLNFVIQNVSNATINFDSMAAAVTLNGNNVGNVSSFPPVPIAIPGNSEQSVNVTLDLSVLGILSQMETVINTPGTQLNFEAKGNTNVNGLVLPFDLVQSVSI